MIWNFHYGKKIIDEIPRVAPRPELLVMSGGFSPLHARMSEVLGYEAFFMSGSQVAAYVYGYPDVGLLGLNEMVEVGAADYQRRAIFRSSPTPTPVTATR